MTHRQGSFIWYELMTPDPDAARNFYGKVVGWQIGKNEMPGGAMDYRMIKRSDGGNAGGVLALTSEMQRNGANPCWLGYLSVDDVDAQAKAIAAEGGAIRMPPTTIDGVGRIGMVSDPQGAPFYVMKPTPPAGNEDKKSDVFSPDKPQHIRWNELATSDPDAAIAFYRKHFGWDQQGEMDMGPLGKYRFMQHHGVGIGAVMPKLEQMPASMWSFYIGVDDVDRAVGSINSGGGRIMQEPMEIPGGEYALNGIDPQGAAFGLVGPRRR